MVVLRLWTLDDEERLRSRGLFPEHRKLSLCFHSVDLRPTGRHRARPNLFPTNNELAAKRVWSFTCTSPGCDARAAAVVGHPHFGCRVAFRLFPANGRV